MFAGIVLMLGLVAIAVATAVLTVRTGRKRDNAAHAERMRKAYARDRALFGQPNVWN